MYFFLTLQLLIYFQMLKIKLRLKSDAILNAKRIAFDEIFIPEDLDKVIKIRFEPLTGHLHISGISKGRATSIGKLRTKGITKASKSVNITSIKGESVKIKTK